MEGIYQVFLDKERNIISTVSSNVTQEGYVEITEAQYRQIVSGGGAKFQLLENKEIKVLETSILITPPPSISARQLRLWLLSRGLLDRVEPLISQLPETERSAARIEWEYATSYDHNHRFVQILGNALGLGQKAMNKGFFEAAQL